MRCQITRSRRAAEQSTDCGFELIGGNLQGIGIGHGFIVPHGRPILCFWPFSIKNPHNCNVNLLRSSMRTHQGHHVGSHERNSLSACCAAHSASRKRASSRYRSAPNGADSLERLRLEAYRPGGPENRINIQGCARQLRLERSNHRIARGASFFNIHVPSREVSAIDVRGLAKGVYRNSPGLLLPISFTVVTSRIWVD